MSVLREQAERERHKPIVYQWPVSRGWLTTAQGERSNPLRGYHPGVDIAADAGTPVCASARGIVSLVRETHRGTVYGRRVFIDHPDGKQTRYNHLDTIAVEQHQAVQRGQRIGTVGNTGLSTGPHLDYEIVDTQTIEHRTAEIGYERFVDPIRFLCGTPDTLRLGSGVGRYRGHIYNKTEIAMRGRGTYDEERFGPHREAK